MDAIDLAAGLLEGDALHVLRRRRPEFVGGAEACRAAVLHPQSKHGLGRDLRAALACRMVRLNADDELTSEYQAILQSLAPSQELLVLAEGGRMTVEPLATIARHVDLVTLTPTEAQADHIRRLEAAGLTNPQIVALSELIAFVNFQTRVVAGLRLLRSA
ncbi:hypothetical protein [Tianweitania sp.]|uniref:CMD domain-containing protein n=1 Tax=Tianweitania sp. TaxID=2021634 RepID=UPI002896D25E|nr:hypothetical protein [Tianweitania sp.]